MKVCISNKKLFFMHMGIINWWSLGNKGKQRQLCMSGTHLTINHSKYDIIHDITIPYKVVDGPTNSTIYVASSGLSKKNPRT